MACCPDVEWVQARIDATKAMIVAYEDAILALSSGAQSYRLSTGQTDQSVTKSDLTQMRTVLGVLEDRLQYYQNKLCGGAAVYVRPRF
jgi:hypothetical protein